MSTTKIPTYFDLPTIIMDLLWSKQRQLTVYCVTPVVIQDELMVGTTSSYHNIKVRESK